MDIRKSMQAVGNGLVSTGKFLGANAGKGLTGVHNFYNDHEATIWGWGTFVPAVIMISTSGLSPYMTIPFSVGAGAFSVTLGLEISDCSGKIYSLFRGAIAGVALSFVSLIASINLKEKLIDPETVSSTISDQLKTACWIPGDKFTLADGKYTVVADSIGRLTSLDASGKPVEGSEKHYGVFAVTFSYGDGVTGKPVSKTEKVSTDERNGPFKPEDAEKNCLRLGTVAP